MNATRLRPCVLIFCAVVFAAFSQKAAAATLCVNPSGSNGCYSTIQAAVNHASVDDVINVEAGTYNEEVRVGKPLSLIGASADAAIINASGLAHGIFVDGLDNPGLHDVTISGFTVKDALFEGVLLLSATDVTVHNNHIIDNDQSSGLGFTGDPTGCPGQPGDGVYENDETGDCGGALHLIGITNSIISDNLITGNADGVLISDETAASHDNLLIHNNVTNNPLECGIVLASHPPMGAIGSAHHGVHHNTVTENISTNNGVKVGGSGVGLFSDGIGQGRASENVVARNELFNNGLGGVALHTHVGPNFGLPPDDMDGNTIVGNLIAGNLADTDDTATPGKVGININSGEGGTPVFNTTISGNVIWDEDIDIAINTPTELDAHINDLLGGKVGAGNICVYDYTVNKDTKALPGACAKSVVDARENYWGCAAGPGSNGCSTTYGANVRFYPWLPQPTGNSHDH